jgi:hypothetical protein
VTRLEEGGGMVIRNMRDETYLSFADSLIVCLVGWLVGWLAGCLFVCLFVCLLGWLVGCWMRQVYMF